MPWQGRTWTGTIGAAGGTAAARADAEAGGTEPARRRVARIGWATARRALRTGDPAGTLTRRAGTADAILLAAGPRVPADGAALAAILGALPAGRTAIVSLPHPAWEDDAIHAILAAHGALLGAEVGPGTPDPVLRRTGGGVALLVAPDVRLGAAWADRLAAFTAAGYDAWILTLAPSAGP